MMECQYTTQYKHVPSLFSPLYIVVCVRAKRDAPGMPQKSKLVITHTRPVQLHMRTHYGYYIMVYHHTHISIQSIHYIHYSTCMQSRYTVNIQSYTTYIARFMEHM